MSRRQSWFSTLRRDGRLFGLVATLVMLLNVVQPLTAANAGEGGGWVICTVFGAEKPLDGKDLPTAWPEKCPICLAAGAGCPAAPAYKADLSSEPAFAEPAREQAWAWETSPVLVLAERPGDPPTAIRGPPLSV